MLVARTRRCGCLTVCPTFPFRSRHRDGDGPGGPARDPAGRGAHPVLHAGRDQGHGQGHDARSGSEGSGAQIVLANTYHLALRPGSDTVARLGGLHAFMRWDGPLLTDSGGYQVFSLRDTAKVDDERGAPSARSTTGRRTSSRPERAMAEQQRLGADFDHVLRPVPAGDGHRATRWPSGRAHHGWASGASRPTRSAAALGTDGPQMLLGIVQGGVDAELRRASADGCWRSASPGTPSAA